MIPTIFLSRPKLVLDYQCPKCKKVGIAALPTIKTDCINCHSMIEVNPKIDLYFTIAKKLNQLLGNNNEVHLIGERDEAKNHDSRDLLRTKSTHDFEIYKTLLAIKNNFEKMGNWETGELEEDKSESPKTECKNCGFCNNCVTCKSCKNKYKPKEVKTKKGIELRYTCPRCNSKSYRETYTEGNKCMFCKSTNIRRTSISSRKKKCPKCGSENIKKPKKIPVYRLMIKRQRRFKKDE